jgi:hypothetical protein
MIQVRIVSGFIADEITARLPLEDTDLVKHYMKTEGKKPGQVFDAMIALGMDWEIEYEEATDKEANEWALADVICRKVRAEKMGKTIILEGEPISYGKFQEKVIDFMERTGFFPDIIADNSESYILGIAEHEEEVEP